MNMGAILGIIILAQCHADLFLKQMPEVLGISQ